jgi:hypothetical protein
MGMFDYVKVHTRFLPDTIKEHAEGWQTKSHECSLNLLTIEEDGKLYVDNIIDNWERPSENKFLSYTGEIRFYDTIDDVWWEFVAFFEKGNLLKVIQVKPEY